MVFLGFLYHGKLEPFPYLFVQERWQSAIPNAHRYPRKDTRFNWFSKRTLNFNTRYLEITGRQGLGYNASTYITRDRNALLRRTYIVYSSRYALSRGTEQNLEFLHHSDITFSQSGSHICHNVVINPRHAFAARVTVHGLCVSTLILALQATRRLISDTSGFRTTRA